MELVGILDTICTKRNGHGESWLWMDGEQPVLYVDISDSLEHHDEEELADLRRKLGTLPCYVISADISGRHPGVKIATKFSKLILDRKAGVARDDYTDHLWTLSEIAGGINVKGHSFCDT